MSEKPRSVKHLQEDVAMKHSSFTAYLKTFVDDVCNRLAAKFDLYDERGKPRRAFILNALIRYGCLGCIVKALANPVGDWVDAVYRENHRLAVGLLHDRVKAGLEALGVNAISEEEAGGSYARADICVKLGGNGVSLSLNGAKVVVEVKTGVGLSYAQLFRYFLDTSETVYVAVWRVPLKQLIIFDRKRMEGLLWLALEAACRKANAILTGKAHACTHDFGLKHAVASQQEIDNFLEGLSLLPAVADAIINLAVEALSTQQAQSSNKPKLEDIKT